MQSLGNKARRAPAAVLRSPVTTGNSSSASGDPVSAVLTQDLSDKIADVIRGQLQFIIRVSRDEAAGAVSHI
jgi:hypothetical protein